MTYPSITLLALSFALLGVSRAEEPASSAHKEATVLTQQAAKRGFYKIRVTTEGAGKDEASYVAYCSEHVDRQELYCTGSLAIGDVGYWRVNVGADMRSDADDANVEISIYDLKAVAKKADGATVPIEIFSTSVESKGLGSYLMGEVQGMTIKIEISAAEATLEPPASRSLPK